MPAGSALTVLLPAALFIIMLGMGISLKPDDFRQATKRPSVILLGLVLQLIILPVLGFIVVTLLQLPAVLAAGLMILAFAPGGATSNMVSYLCRADTALSICLTGFTSLLIPLTLPLLSYLVLEHFMGQGIVFEIPMLSMMTKLLVVTLIPVIVGVMLNQRWPELCLELQKIVKLLSLLFMLIVVVLITASNFARLPQLLPQLAPAVLLLAGSAMLCGYLVPRYLFNLEVKIGLTLAIETGIQNAGTALMVTGAILQSPEMSMSALLYGILMQIPAMLLIIFRNVTPIWLFRREI